MTSRVVRQSSLKRVLSLLDERGVTPPCLDLLPGGAVRVHLTPPEAANDASELEREQAAWDAALQ